MNRMMKDVDVERKTPSKLAALIVLLGLSATGTAKAVTVFSETFEGYTSFPTGTGTNASNEGIPMKLEGAQEAWYAARFQAGSGGAATGAGLLFKINTTGLNNINLSFNWATDKTVSSDKLVVGYHIGPISGFGTCSGNGEAGCFADLRASSITPLPWYTTETVGATTLTGNWTQMLSGSSPVTTVGAGWQSASFNLSPTVEN